MRRAAVTAAAVALLAGSAWVALAEAQRKEGPWRLDRQTHRAVGASETPAGSDWGPAPGLADILVCGPRGRVAVTVSLDLEGDAVDVRVHDGDRLLKPGEVRFDPGSQRGSSSFTFLGSARGDPLKAYEVQWRSASPPADDTELRSGSALVLWSRTPKVGCE